MRKPSLYIGDKPLDDPSFDDRPGRWNRFFQPP